MFDWIYLVAAAAIAGIMMWGKLEWHASILLGLIGPFVGVVFGIFLSFFFALILPSSIVNTWPFAVLMSYVPAIVGAYFLARSMRKKLGSGSRPKGGEA